MSTIAPPAPVERRQRFGHVRPLDGLRAVAVLLVLGYHAGVPGFVGGRAGVDMFFVLSGFLITSLLLDEHRLTGGIRLGAFYARRALRLYPALLVAVTGALTLAFLKMPVFHASAASLRDTLHGIPFTLFYTMNVARATGWTNGGLLGHAWSLAIEEQFYLVWPVAVILLFRRRADRARIGWIALGCAVASAALRSGLAHAGVNSETLYNATFSHVDGIFAGCAFAVLWAERPQLVRHWAGPAVTAAAVGALGAVVVAGPRFGTLEFPAAAVATVAVTAAVLSRPASPLAAALSSPAAVEVGRRSYGIYLYHWPIFIFLGLRTPAKALLLGIPLSLAAAWISYAFVERPFLRLKQRWSTNDPGSRTAGVS